MLETKCLKGKVCKMYNYKNKFNYSLQFNIIIYRLPNNGILSRRNHMKIL